MVVGSDASRSHANWIDVMFLGITGTAGITDAHTATVLDSSLEQGHGLCR